MSKGIKNRQGAKQRYAMQVKKKVKKTTITKAAAGRARARVLYNGVAAPPPRPFGSKGGRVSLKAMDARLPIVAGLPRAVAPYAFIRTTAVIKMEGGQVGNRQDMLIFAPFRFYGAATGENQWLSWCGIRQSGADTDLVSGAAGIQPLLVPTNVLGSAAELVPSAMTVQVVNANGMNNANGTYLMARCNQGLHFGGTSATTWGDLKAQFVSYFSPRMLAAGKLALRGSKCSSYPIDMTEFSDFAPRANVVTTAWDSAFQPGALAPIVFVPNQASDATATSIQFLVTIEWRVRFDPLNPAVAAHDHHPITSDAAWDSLTRIMSTAGHGVEEMAEDVAEGGAIYTGVRAAATAAEFGLV